jgi:TPR repeat protein
MVASGEASAQTTFAVIAQYSTPYFASTQDIYRKPALGQFEYNMHLCVKDVISTLQGVKTLELILPSGETVYSMASDGAFVHDPAGDKKCMSQVTSTTPPANIPPPVQRAPQPAPNYVPPPTMAASGSAYAPTANDVRFASVYNFAAIVRAPVSYYADNVNINSLDSATPLGQFVAKQHICVSFVLPIVRGGKIASILLPGSGNVKVLYNTETFIPDPPNNRGCEEAAGQYNLGQSQRTADAVADTPSPWTSAQSASPGQPPSEATHSESTVGGTGADVGSLDAGLAAEKRGDWKAAFLLLEPLAKQGNADAQTQIGFMFETGRGHRDAPPDTFNVTSGILASQWYSKAALQGNAQAQVGVGRSYKHCCGPNPASYAEAMKWFRKAADQGNAEGQFQLGYMYYEGKGGISQDFAEARKWFRKAADQGYGQAQGALGFMYERAQGVPQDYAEAMKWYRTAADQGNPDAQKYLERLSEETIKSTVPDLPDPPMQDSKEARAALSFLERDLTISTNFAGDSEPGLASLQSINGGLCHLRCGFHLAVGIGQGGVLDSEVEFALSDINVDTIRYNMDGIGRAFLSFETSDGTPRFSSRSREMDMDQKVLSPWTEWEGADKGSCRAKGYKDSLERDMKALAYIAKSCGAKPSPF